MYWAFPGVSSDMRELLAACAAGNEKAILAEKMYYYRIKKYIGAYAAALGGVDIILFTGGVGENQMECRREVCKDMEFMGIELDNDVNAKVRGEEAIISTADSKVKVVVIPTDEELLIASDTMDILKKYNFMLLIYNKKDGLDFESIFFLFLLCISNSYIQYFICAILS